MARQAPGFDALKAVVNTEAGDETVHTWVNRGNTDLVPLGLPWRLTADGLNRVVRKEPR